jgi:hypothetical protein
MPSSRASTGAPGPSDDATEAIHVQESIAVTRKSVLSGHASSLVEPELPLRAYFLSVGGALLLLLFAADWVLPAPLPSRHADSHPVPPIRIRSDVKGPEAVVIDTSRAPSPAMLADSDGVARPSQPPGPEAADTAAESTAPSTDAQFRESMAQLQPAVSDEADRKPREMQAPLRKLAQARPGLRRRSARHRSLETRLGNCASFGREHGRCRYALAPNW